MYAPPAGHPPGAPSSHAPAGGYTPPPGTPRQARPLYGHDTSPQGRSGRGAASDYYDGPPPVIFNTPDNAAARGDSLNPARFQPHPSDEFDEEAYKSHFSAHDQAYSSGYDDKPMSNVDIGTAAAIEALKLTVTNSQSGIRPQQGGWIPD